MPNLMANNRYAATRRRCAIAPKLAKASRQTDVGSGIDGGNIVGSYCAASIQHLQIELR